MTTMRQAMPEATVLYTVTAVVVLGLIVWVAAVLKTAREPWARPHAPRQSGIESLPPASSGSEPSKDAKEAARDAKAATGDIAKGGADSTARATPVALANEDKARTGTKDEDKDDAGA